MRVFSRAWWTGVFGLRAAPAGDDAPVLRIDAHGRVVSPIGPGEVMEADYEECPDGTLRRIRPWTIRRASETPDAL